MHLSNTATAERGNVAAANHLPPYRGFRHQVQPRNAELATAVEIFFRVGDFEALKAYGARKSTGEQVMLVVYLIANDFAAAARELATGWRLSLMTALALLDGANGRELADVLGWARGA